MSIPAEMFSLVQDHSGFAVDSDGTELKTLDSYLTAKKIAVPKPGKGEVLIKMNLASVNPSDVMFIKGIYGQPRAAGMPAGFEGTGVVVESGGGFMANRLKGKRVAFYASKSGTWSEYALTVAQACVPLRDDVSDEDGAGLIVNPVTACAMFDIVKQEGAKAFVLTAGASQLCKLMSGLARDEGYRAISIVRREEQIEPLKKLGAAHVLNSESDSFKSELRGLLKEEKPRIFLDAVTGEVASVIFNEMGRGSRWIVYGRLDMGPTRLIEPGQLIFKGKKIEGFWTTSWMRQTSLLRKLSVFRMVQERFASGIWKTDIGAEIPLAEAHARLPEALARANAGKVLLKP